MRAARLPLALVALLAAASVLGCTGNVTHDAGEPTAAVQAEPAAPSDTAVPTGDVIAELHPAAGDAAAEAARLGAGGSEVVADTSAEAPEGDGAATGVATSVAADSSAAEDGAATHSVNVDDAAAPVGAAAEAEGGDGVVEVAGLDAGTQADVDAASAAAADSSSSSSSSGGGGGGGGGRPRVGRARGGGGGGGNIRGIGDLPKPVSGG